VGPDLSGEEVKLVLMDSARRIPGLEQKLVAGGVIDAYAAVLSALQFGRRRKQPE
jgi:hypothetical protein